MSETYCGYECLKLSSEELARLYQEGTFEQDFCENEYLIVVDDDNKPIDYFRYRNNKFEKITYPTIQTIITQTIKPRNMQQVCAMDLLRDRTTPVKIIRGVYGSGKDYLMLYQALQLIEEGKFQKIVFVRPNVTVAGVPDIGALPGNEFEKLAWTLAPLYDKVGGEMGVRQLIDNEQLETVPLGFIRGRSFDNSIVYVCEGQNMTTEIVKLLIGRIGENSELWINGDSHQVDKRLFETQNGITQAVNRLKGHKLFGYVYLPITERSEVARLADLLDE